MKLDATSLRERLRALASGGATVIGEEPQPTPRPVEPEELARPEAAQTGARTLRVSLETLDRILDLTGEIAVDRGRLRDALERGDHDGRVAAEMHRESDRLHADLVMERHPTLEYLPAGAPEAAGQIVSGIYPDRWTGKSATVVLKSPKTPKRLSVTFYFPAQAGGRYVRLLLDGREVAAQNFRAAGQYTLSASPILPSGPVAAVEIDLDRTFTAPSDQRQLGIILSGLGFVP